MRYIYKIQFPNNKCYIGQTKNVEQRMQAYKNLRCKDMPRLYYALKKYKFENCNIKILAECDDNKADELESKYIKEYISNNSLYGYNLDSGGCKNKSHSVETKEKISKSKTGILLSQSHRESLSKSHMGRAPWNKGLKNIYSKDTLEKMSKNRIGKRKGYKQSKETKEKIGKANSIKLLGKKHSEKTKMKQSDGMKLYWKRKKG